MPDNDQPKYLIDKILPANRIHLLAGISSAGKSYFSIPALIMFEAGMPILGLPSHPVKWCVVISDKTAQDTYDLLKKTGFSPSDVDIIPAFGKNSIPKHKIMEEVESRGAKLVLWEGFDMMVKNINNGHEVSEFLSEVTAYCENGLTVLGTVGQAKLKPHEMYQNPRQLVAGSSFWERCTSTDMIIIPINPKDISDPRRLMYVCLKNDPSFAVCGQFTESGWLAFEDHDNRHRAAKIAEAPANERAKLWYSFT